VLQLYRGSGSAEVQLDRAEATPEQWQELRTTTIALLRARNNQRAAELLYVFPWEIWDASNSFNDEFSVLYFATTPEEYVQLEQMKATERQAFRAIAEAVTEVSSFYIRFIVVAIARDAGEVSERVTAADETDAFVPADEAMPYQFDVAISFAGSERGHAEQLAVALRSRGVAVFYDNFYAEELWGKDLAVFFDDVFRTRARFCIIFVSAEYAARMWTTLERKSAMARALAEREHEYILPVRVDETDLLGLPPSIGYLSLRVKSINEIAELLVRKLRRS
jgi:hypothetical protein